MDKVTEVFYKIAGVQPPKPTASTPKPKTNPITPPKPSVTPKTPTASKPIAPTGSALAPQVKPSSPVTGTQTTPVEQVPRPQTPPVTQAPRPQTSPMGQQPASQAAPVNQQPQAPAAQPPQAAPQPQMTGAQAMPPEDQTGADAFQGFTFNHPESDPHFKEITQEDAWAYGVPFTASPQYISTGPEGSAVMVNSNGEVVRTWQKGELNPETVERNRNAYRKHEELRARESNPANPKPTQELHPYEHPWAGEGWTFEVAGDGSDGRMLYNVYDANQNFVGDQDTFRAQQEEEQRRLDQEMTAQEQARQQAYDLGYDYEFSPESNPDFQELDEGDMYAYNIPYDPNKKYYIKYYKNQNDPSFVVDQNGQPVKTFVPGELQQNFDKTLARHSEWEEQKYNEQQEQKTQAIANTVNQAMQSPGFQEEYPSLATLSPEQLQNALAGNIEGLSEQQIYEAAHLKYSYTENPGAAEQAFMQRLSDNDASLQTTELGDSEDGLHVLENIAHLAPGGFQSNPITSYAYDALNKAVPVEETLVRGAHGFANPMNTMLGAFDPEMDLSNNPAANHSAKTDVVNKATSHMLTPKPVRGNPVGHMRAPQTKRLPRWKNYLGMKKSVQTMRNMGKAMKGIGREAGAVGDNFGPVGWGLSSIVSGGLAGVDALMNMPERYYDDQGGRHPWKALAGLSADLTDAAVGTHVPGAREISAAEGIDAAYDLMRLPPAAEQFYNRRLESMHNEQVQAARDYLQN